MPLVHLRQRNAVAVVRDRSVFPFAALRDHAVCRGSHGHLVLLEVAHLVEGLLRNGRGHRLGNHLRRGHRVHGAHDRRGRLRVILNVGVEGGRVRLLRLGQLLKKRLRRVEFKRQRGLSNSDGGGLLAHFFPLEIALQCIEEETVVRYAVPVEDLLLLLGADAVVLVEEIEECALGLLERSIGAGLEVAQVGEDTLLELLGVLDGAAEGLESEREASHDVGAGNVEEVVPAGALATAAAGAHSQAQAYQSTQETYSPVGSRKRRMYWSGCQSTGAEMRKYLTGNGVS